MKKSMFAAVCLGGLFVAGNASALDVSRARAVRIDLGALAGQAGQPGLPPQAAGPGVPSPYGAPAPYGSPAPYGAPAPYGYGAPGPYGQWGQYGQLGQFGQYGQHGERPELDDIGERPELEDIGEADEYSPYGYGQPGFPAPYGVPGVPGPCGVPCAPVAIGPCGSPCAPAQPPVVQAAPIAPSALGLMSFTALGFNSDTNSCQYLADWVSPMNPNDVVTCVLNEAVTAFTPSCIDNESQDITTALASAEPVEHQITEQVAGDCGGCQTKTTTVTVPVCAGFNIKGESFDDVSLLLGETPAGVSGLEIIRGAANPTVYPIVLD